LAALPPTSGGGGFFAARPGRSAVRGGGQPLARSPRISMRARPCRAGASAWCATASDQADAAPDLLKAATLASA